MATRTTSPFAPIALFLVASVGCGAEASEQVHSLRMWPMGVPGMNNDSGFQLASSSSEDAEPQSETLGCRYVGWCCYSMRCENNVTQQFLDMFVCPSQRGRTNDRAGAWDVWKHHVKVELRALRARHGVCWIQGASCYDDPHGAPCGNYPN